MPPKKAVDPSGTLTLTARDQELLAGALRSAKSNIDYQKFADTCEFGTAASAKTAWFNLKKKVGLGAADARAVKIVVEDGAKVGGKGGKKRKATSEPAEDDNEGAEASPVKKIKGKKGSEDVERGEVGAAKKGKGPKKWGKKGKAGETQVEGWGEGGSEDENEEIAVAAKKGKRVKKGTKSAEVVKNEDEDENKDVKTESE